MNAAKQSAGWRQDGLGLKEMHDVINSTRKTIADGQFGAGAAQLAQRFMVAAGANEAEGFCAAVAECLGHFHGIQSVRIFFADPNRPAIFNLLATHPASDPLGATLSLETVFRFSESAKDARRRFAEVDKRETQAGLPNIAVVLREGKGRPKAVVLADCDATAAQPGFADELDQLAELIQTAFESWSAVRQIRQREETLKEKLSQVTDACGLANAELGRAARLSDQFLANMSHELRTPLNTVLGMAQALQEGVMGPINDDQMNYLQMIEKAGRQLLGMLTDILTLSKAGAGRLEVHPETVAIQALCQDCLHFVVQPARQKHLKLEMKCDPQAPLIEADENFLKQILVNLLTNAVKFTPDRGAVSLVVTGLPEEHAIMFSVTDSGIGIPAEKMERLFTPFVQMQDGGLARQYPGTGLGLSLVYRLTDLHGGSVEAISAEGQGSTFSVKMPWTPPASAAGAQALPGDLQGHLLLVDDNERSLAATQAILAGAGCQVMTARQGAEALERAAEERLDLVLVDLQLSGMNGWALMKHFQANPRLRDISIIALTSQVLPGERERCLAEGALDWLVRPVSPGRLLQTVAAVLKRNSCPEKAVHS